MKKKSLFILPILATLVFVAGCNNNNSAKLQAHTVDAFILDDYGLTRCGRSRYFFINDSSIPYKRIEDFVRDYMVWDYSTGLASFKVATSGKTSVVTNLSSGATAVIDYKKQTITYDDLTAYYNDSNRSAIPVGCDFGGDQFFIGKPTSERNAPQRCVVSLSDYNVHAYLIGGYGYIPETFMLQALTPIAPIGAIFNGKACYYVDGLPGTTSAFDQGVKRIRDAATIFNQEYMQYNYDVLAFMFDFRLGLTGLTHNNRNLSAYEPSHTFFEDGAYATLAKYKDGLCSTELDVANAALACVVQDELCDGGHSFYWCHDIFSTLEGSLITFYSYIASMAGAHFDNPESYENCYLGNLYESLGDARGDTKADPITITGDDEATAGFKIYPSVSKPDKKVAYLVFDSFISPEETGGPGRASDIYESNYYDNTISLVYWANKQLKANSDVKDIVIDLSCNGGGNAYAEQFIASWLCGGTSKLILSNRHDKTHRTLVRHADVNLDGKFDSSDYLSDDYNVYCLFSNASFSCGNLLPCDLKDHAKVNLNLLGTKTGGGCCSVESNHFNALGGNVTLSSLYTLCREGSTPDNVVTVEDGVEGGFTKYPFAAGDELTSPEKFFAVDNIINAIVS